MLFPILQIIIINISSNSIRSHHDTVDKYSVTPIPNLSKTKLPL